MKQTSTSKKNVILGLLAGVVLAFTAGCSSAPDPSNGALNTNLTDGTTGTLNTGATTTTTTTTETTTGTTTGSGATYTDNGFYTNNNCTGASCIEFQQNNGATISGTVDQQVVMDQGREAGMFDSVNYGNGIYYYNAVNGTNEAGAHNCLTDGGTDCPWKLRLNWAASCAEQGIYPFAGYLSPVNWYQEAAQAQTCSGSSCTPIALYPTFGYIDVNNNYVAVGAPYNAYDYPYTQEITATSQPCSFFPNHAPGAPAQTITTQNGLPAVTSNGHTYLIQLIALGEPGCVSGAQTIFLPVNGKMGNITQYSQIQPMAISEAVAGGVNQLMTLSPSSTPDNLQLGVSNVSQWIYDKTWNAGAVQPFNEITVDNGDTIQVTDEHVMVLADGSLKQAMSVHVGDSLLLVDGPHTVQSIKMVSLPSRAYNAVVADSAANFGILNHIMVVSNFLTGDYTAQLSSAQVTSLNRELARMAIPAELLSK